MNKATNFMRWCAGKSNNAFIILCLIAHILLEIIYILEDLEVAFIINTFSVLYYAAIMFIIRKFTNKVIELSCYEIITFASVMVILLGFSSFFWVYSLGVAAIIFLLLGYKEKSCLRIQITAVISFILSLLLNKYLKNIVFDNRIGSINNINAVFSKVNISAVIIFVYVMSYLYSVEIFYTKKQLEESNANLLYLAEHDTLTGLLNRTSLMRTIERFKNNEDEQEILVCMMDIDFFKKVNDTYGHAVGDKVLTDVSTLMEESLKDFYNVRWGGEEFLILSSVEYTDSLVECIEVFHSNIRNLKFKELPSGITATIGVTKGKRKDIEGLIIKADELLYIGKQNGRNKIVRGKEIYDI